MTSKKEQSRWDLSLSCGRPFGAEGSTARTVKALGLENTVRGKGGNQYRWLQGDKNHYCLPLRFSYTRSYRGCGEPDRKRTEKLTVS